MHEFELIKTYFNWPTPSPSVSLGIGDDAALLTLKPNHQLVVSVDTCIAGVHFPLTTPAHAVGYKALAVNLSDIAAMGADPQWFTLALTLPNADTKWLQDFTQGLQQLATDYHLALIGGDTTRGSLSLTIQIMGTVPTGHALLRRGAQVGDDIYVSGTLGDAAAGLAVLQQRLTLSPRDSDYCIERLNYPTPRIALGQWLRDKASSCMDLSDGLLGDLKHILQRSQVGAVVNLAAMPFSHALQTLPKEQSLSYALTGGDDYELVFTLAPEKAEQYLSHYPQNLPPITKIGRITAAVEQLTLEPSLNLPIEGYNHFK